MNEELFLTLIIIVMTVVICKLMYEVYKKMETINDHLKSSSEKNDVYTYSFNKAEVDRINEALMRYDLVKEIRELINE